MRAAQLKMVIATVVFFTAVFGWRAEAMTVMAPAALGEAAAGLAPIRKMVNVCGSNGCVPVQTKRVHRQKPGSVPAHHI